VLAGLFAACAADPAREADRPFTGGMARVDRVELHLVSTRPPRLRVAVEGSLPDACTEIDRVDTRRLGARIEIALPTRRRFGASCPPARTPFSRSIPLALGEDFDLYVVDVNGVSGTVQLPPGLEPDPFERRPLD
jgi:inhibitor of cysteine peptidase